MLQLIISAPSTGAPWRQLGEPVQVWYDNDGSPCAYGHRRGDRHFLRFPGLACYGFERGQLRVTGVPEPAADLSAVEDTFYRSVAPLALYAGGHEALHASAVRTSAGIVALCAASETGKSTLAFALSRQGYPLWADDAVVIRMEESEPRALPLPFSLRLREPAAAHFGAPGVGSAPREHLADAPTAQRVTLICVLERSASGCEAQAELVAPKAAFPLLLTHAYCFSLEEPWRKEMMLRHYLDLAMGVPVYRLTFAPGLERLHSVVKALEALLPTLPQTAGSERSE